PSPGGKLRSLRYSPRTRPPYIGPPTVQHDCTGYLTERRCHPSTSIPYHASQYDEYETKAGSPYMRLVQPSSSYDSTDYLIDGAAQAHGTMRGYYASHVLT
ncbi:unnamed protein product, partial [Ectocarpus sp. 13 AM-2016]